VVQINFITRKRNVNRICTDIFNLVQNKD
jgi:hypothetical protein